MNRHDFWIGYAKHAGISQDKSKTICKSVLDYLAQCIAEEDRVYIVGLGTFKKKKIKSRKLRNVHNGEMITLPDREKIVFEEFRSSMKPSCGEDDDE